MKNLLFCESPRLILNPLIWNAIYQNGTYTCDGVLHRVDRNIAYQWLIIHPFIFPPSSDVDKEYADQFYSVDKDGVVTPAYILVPCNHCYLCNSVKQNEWSQRCLLEAQCYDIPPLFVTLTYNDEYLPYEGLVKADLQKFFKRLRHHIPKFRYFACGEYGKKGRAHYHIIFFLNRCDYNNFSYFCNSVKQSWSRYDSTLHSFSSFGFTYIKSVSMDGTQAFKYVAKYLKKGCVVPTGKNPNFCLSSRGSGGIGFPHFRNFIPNFREHPFFNRSYFSFLDKWSGKVYNFSFNRYFFNKVFPSVSRLVDYRFRVAYKTLAIYSVDPTQSNEFRIRLQEFLSGFSIPLCIFPHRLRASQVLKYAKSHKNFLFYQSLKDIQRRFFRVPLNAFIYDLQIKRDIFLSSLPPREETDLTAIIPQFKRNCQRTLDRLVVE